ncbi:MAG: TonB family protein [Candidatus Brevundimonas colombiensis]|uniref:TonB family protein n=1 Tax=Candidatus Brevundimonas colombiensis TaxID=3121376 RepID=A0AAJ5WYA9_9CAUL|nr:TonB family protein [Brevundimonas sp.]WEK38489.1 MAG: TonB family protein [Brevundimonas sp.]
MRGHTLQIPLRGFVVLSVTAAHAALFLANLPPEHPALQTQGGAPVVNLTLEPSPRFDDTSSAASQVARPAPAASSKRPAPQPKPRQPLLHPLAPEMVSVSPDPAPRYVAQPPTSSVASIAPDVPSLTWNSDIAPSRAGRTQGGGARTLGATATPDEDRYAARVIAWVEAHKGRAAGRSTGVATIRFVLNRRGGVDDSAVFATSGDPGLDALALDAIRNATPFPRAPRTADWRTRTFFVRIDYRRKA